MRLKKHAQLLVFHIDDEAQCRRGNCMQTRGPRDMYERRNIMHRAACFTVVLAAGMTHCKCSFLFSLLLYSVPSGLSAPWDAEHTMPTSAMSRNCAQKLPHPDMRVSDPRSLVSVIVRLPTFCIPLKYSIASSMCGGSMACIELN